MRLILNCHRSPFIHNVHAMYNGVYVLCNVLSVVVCSFLVRVYTLPDKTKPLAYF